MSRKETDNSKGVMMLASFKEQFLILFFIKEKENSSMAWIYDINE